MRKSSVAPAADESATPAPAYTLLDRCASINAVLSVVAGPQLRDAYLEVEAISRGGYGRERYQVPVGPRGEFVDPVLLKLLEEADDWAAYLGLAARERSAAGRPVRLGALLVSTTLPLGEDDDHRPSFPEEAIGRTIERLSTSVLPPSAIVVGGARTQGAGIVVVGLFALTRMVDVRSDAASNDALDLMRRLAAAVGADSLAPDVTHADLMCPLPGTAVRELPPHHRYVVDCLVSDRRYAIEDIQAALLKERSK